MVFVNSRAYCANSADPNGYATLSWGTVGGSKVYILSGPGAARSSDARADGGLQYPYNGSARVPFDCAQPTNYYRLDVYNIEGHGGTTVGVRRD